MMGASGLEAGNAPSMGNTSEVRKEFPQDVERFRKKVGQADRLPFRVGEAPLPSAGFPEIEAEAVIFAGVADELAQDLGRPVRQGHLALDGRPAVRFDAPDAGAQQMYDHPSAPVHLNRY